MFSNMLLLLLLVLPAGYNFYVIVNDQDAGITNTALLVTNSDTVSLIYPKEMGYENDFLHVIFKLKLTNSPESGVLTSSGVHRIEDAVFDNKTWSIYFILSDLLGGSELIRLKKLNRPPVSAESVNFSSPSSSGNYSYQLASNWIFQSVYKNATSKMLSLDVSVAKRRVYWLEFNKYSLVYSFGVLRLNNQRVYKVVINNYSRMSRLSEDGYTFIAVVRDNFEHSPLTLNSKESQILSNIDLTVFISNNETLILCFMMNMTCIDYLRYSNPANRHLLQSNQNEDPLNMDYAYEDDLTSSRSDTTTTMASTTVSVANKNELVRLGEPIIEYGKLVGIQYDWNDNSLVVCDYMSDKIDRIHFKDRVEFRYDYVESLLRLDSLKAIDSKLVTMNPVMSVQHESYIYWIDYDEGLKTISSRASSSSRDQMRLIYKIREPVALKLMFMHTPRLIDKNKNNNSDTSKSSLLPFLKSLQGEGGIKSKYPPDYVLYYKYFRDMLVGAEDPNDSTNSITNAKALSFQNSSTSSSIKSKTHLLFVFLLIVRFFSCLFNFQ